MLEAQRKEISLETERCRIDRQQSQRKAVDRSRVPLDRVTKTRERIVAGPLALVEVQLSVPLDQKRLVEVRFLPRRQLA